MCTSQSDRGHFLMEGPSSHVTLGRVKLRIKTYPQHIRLCVWEILTPSITISEYDNHSESRCQHSFRIWALGGFSKAHLLNQGSFCDHVTLRECLLTSHTGGRDTARPFRKRDVKLVSALTPPLLKRNNVILKREGNQRCQSTLVLAAGITGHRLHMPWNWDVEDRARCLIEHTD